MTGPGIDLTTGRLATAAGAVAIGADATYIVFAVAGQPWGTINDFGYAATGILAAGLAWRLRARAGRIPTVAAVLGGSVTAIGCGLVITGASGWLLSGFVAAL